MIYITNVLNISEILTIKLLLGKYFIMPTFDFYGSSKRIGNSPYITS
jgi:hypothetical protein